MSTPQETNLEAYKGDTFSRTFTIKNNGVAMDLTGYSFKFQGRRRPLAGSTLFAKTISGTDNGSDLPNGVVVVVVTAAEMAALDGVLHYDLEGTLSGVVRTFIRGTISIIPDVSR